MFLNLTGSTLWAWHQRLQAAKLQGDMEEVWWLESIMQAADGL